MVLRQLLFHLFNILAKNAFFFLFFFFSLKKKKKKSVLRYRKTKMLLEIDTNILSFEVFVNVFIYFVQVFQFSCCRCNLNLIFVSWP
jgi:hypothetical protein